MSEIKDGGPAFPSPQDRMPDGTGISAAEYGMSLRDYFAGHAIGAVIAATSAGRHNPQQRAAGDTLEDRMAADAYAIADAMIAQRDKGGASLQH